MILPTSMPKAGCALSAETYTPPLLLAAITAIRSQNGIRLPMPVRQPFRNQINRL